MPGARGVTVRRSGGQRQGERRRSPRKTPSGETPAGGAATVQGTLVSSGLYAATWSWEPGNEAGDGSITVTSDKGTFGHIEVDAIGNITFTSGAPELAQGSPFTGAGGRADVRKFGAVPVVCGMTVDNDLAGSGGAVLHLSGTLTITGNIGGSLAAWVC